MEVSWHCLNFSDVLKKLRTSASGLSLNDAKKLLEKYGPNKIEDRRKFIALKLFFHQFKGFLTVFLLIASAISYLAHSLNPGEVEKSDSFIILGAVFLNVIFGFIQEYKAERIITSLKKHLVNEVHIIRGGQEQIIAAEDLVPGDIVYLKQGDRVAADIRVGYAKNLAVDESPLTGESSSVNKSSETLRGNTILAERKNMVYQGTLIVRGEGKGVVVATGVETELGKISRQLNEKKKEETPLQKKINRLSKFIGLFVLIAFLFILIEGFLQNPNLDALTEIFVVAVAVAVSAIPEGMIVAVTIILAIGMRALSKKKAYLRRLSAAETLGGVTVVLTDKTGTLTQARMAVDNIFYESSPKNKDRFYKALVFANSARIENPSANFADWHYTGSPTEQALLKKAISEVDHNIYFSRENFILDGIPFDSVNKFQARLTKGKSANFIYFVGAPEITLGRCSFKKNKRGVQKLTVKSKKEIANTYKDLANKGLRVLGVAYKKTSLKQKTLEEKNLDNLVFLGLVTLKDPLRRDVKKVMDLTKKSGIRTVIVTGDHALTAKAVADDLGFNVQANEILSGESISRLSEHELQMRLRKIKVFARVSPHDKVRILEAYQKQGEVVAMTGDGINDALALKEADIGVALGSGQEVAREASDLVLLNDNFSNIIAAIRQGRVIFDNVRKVIVYLLSGSFTEILLVSASIMLGLPLPLLPAQILWVNLIEDGLPDFALAFEPEEDDTMKRKPRPPKEPLIDREMRAIIFIIGLIADFFLLGLFFYLLRKNHDINYIRSFIFAALTIGTFFIVFAIKSLRKPFYRGHLFNNRYLIGAVFIGILMLLAAIYAPFLQNLLKLVPLKPTDWLVVLALGMTKFFGIEFTKWIFYRRNK